MKYSEDTLHIAPTPIKLSQELAGWFFAKATECSSRKKPFYVAISGGNTPILFFTQLANSFGRLIDWNCVHFFWANERSYTKPGAESNYKNAYNHLISKIAIPEQNIHEIKFETNIEHAVEMYSLEIQENIPIVDDIPQFDLVMLGLGYDGHTASIFPNQEKLIYSGNFVELSENPENKEKLITITPYLINNALNISFHATGLSKSEMVRTVLLKLNNDISIPASHIKPVNGTLNWFIDSGAASKLFV